MEVQASFVHVVLRTITEMQNNLGMMPQIAIFPNYPPVS